MNQKGVAIWLTGLPSAGKTTIAEALQKNLKTMGLVAVLLDSDDLRPWLSKGLGFTRKDRDEHIHRVSEVAYRVIRGDAIAIVAAISPYQEARDRARKRLGLVLEVYVKCPVEVCILRDVKGLYRKAKSGGVTNMTGLDDPYEPPQNPDIVVQTDAESVEDCVAKVLGGLRAKGYIG